MKSCRILKLADIVLDLKIIFRRCEVKTKILFKDGIYGIISAIIIFFMAATICYGLEAGSGKAAGQGYDIWKTIGKTAIDNAFVAMEKAGAKPRKGNIIVLTNAGYAEVN